MNTKVTVGNEAVNLYNGLLSGETGNKLIQESENERDTGNPDNFLKDNTSWYDLHKLHASFVMIMRTHAAHSVAARNQYVMARISDKPLYMMCLGALLKHMRILASELKDIYSQHSSFNGGAKDHEDILKTIEFYDMYMTFQERHEAILVPTSTIICELVAEAEEKLKNEGLTSVIDDFRVAMHNFINGVKPQPVEETVTDVIPKPVGIVKINDVEVKNVPTTVDLTWNTSVKWAEGDAPPLSSVVDHGTPAIITDNKINEEPTDSELVNTVFNHVVMMNANKPLPTTINITVPTNSNI